MLDVDLCPARTEATEVWDGLQGMAEMEESSSSVVLRVGVSVQAGEATALVSKLKRRLLTTSLALQQEQ